jgi:hypothetical protein
MARSLVTRIVGRLRERRGRRAPRLAPPGPSAAASPPIFVIGPHRSGTSLVRRILDSHSRIACPPESKFLLPLAEMLRDGQAMGGLDSMGYDRQAVLHATSTFVRSFFDAYASARGKQRWADKTPNYVGVLPELWELFGPDARFVLILRHGLDVAHSLSDPHRTFSAVTESVARWGGPPEVAAGRYWAEQSSRIEEFRAAHPEACHAVRYEELTTDPVPVLQRMFSFLDEPWEPQVMEYGRFPHDAGFEDPDVRRRKRIVANSGKYREWPPDVQLAVREVCEPMLSRLGYS